VSLCISHDEERARASRRLFLDQGGRLRLPARRSRLPPRADARGHWALPAIRAITHAEGNVTRSLPSRANDGPRRRRRCWVPWKGPSPRGCFVSESEQVVEANVVISATVAGVKKRGHCMTAFLLRWNIPAVLADATVAADEPRRLGRRAGIGSARRPGCDVSQFSVGTDANQRDLGGHGRIGVDHACPSRAHTTALVTGGSCAHREPTRHGLAGPKRHDSRHERGTQRPSIGAPDSAVAATLAVAACGGKDRAMLGASSSPRAPCQGGIRKWSGTWRLRWMISRRRTPFRG
jgi:hypothetical protein